MAMLRVRMILHISPVICKFTRAHLSWTAIKKRQGKHNTTQPSKIAARFVFSKFENLPTSKRLHPLFRFDHAPNASFPFICRLARHPLPKIAELLYLAVGFWPGEVSQPDPTDHCGTLLPRKVLVFVECGGILRASA